MRLAASLGYRFNAKQKVETGIDYRVDRLEQSQARHRAWWSVNLYWDVFKRRRSLDVVGL